MALLAVVVNIFLPVDLDFVPSFIVAIFVVYVFRLETLKDGLVATFMIYIFNEGILNTVGLALLYFSNEPYPMITIDSWLILSPIIAAISTLVAGYIGIWLAKTRKPSRVAAVYPARDAICLNAEVSCVISVPIESEFYL